MQGRKLAQFQVVFHTATPIRKSQEKPGIKLADFNDAA
jgi:hypothetical protein